MLHHIFFTVVPICPLPPYDLNIMTLWHIITKKRKSLCHSYKLDLHDFVLQSLPEVLSGTCYQLISHSNFDVSNRKFIVPTSNDHHPSARRGRCEDLVSVGIRERLAGCWHARLKISRFFRTVKFYKINFWLLWISSILFYKSFHVWVISNSSDKATFFSKEKYFFEQNKLLLL